MLAALLDHLSLVHQSSKPHRVGLPFSENTETTAICSLKLWAAAREPFFAYICLHCSKLTLLKLHQVLVYVHVFLITLGKCNSFIPCIRSVCSDLDEIVDTNCSNQVLKVLALITPIVSNCCCLTSHTPNFPGPVLSQTASPFQRCGYDSLSLEVMVRVRAALTVKPFQKHPAIFSPLFFISLFILLAFIW